MLQAAGRAFLNMHVLVRDAVDVDNVFASGHNDVGGSGVAERDVLVLDHLGILVPFVWRNVVEGAGSEEGFGTVTAVGPFALVNVEWCGQVWMERRVVGSRDPRGGVFGASSSRMLLTHRRLRGLCSQLLHDTRCGALPLGPMRKGLRRMSLVYLGAGLGRCDEACFRVVVVVAFRVRRRGKAWVIVGVVAVAALRVRAVRAKGCLEVCRAVLVQGCCRQSQGSNSRRCRRGAWQVIIVRPVGRDQAVSRFSFLRSACVTPDLGSFNVDGSQPPRQKQGGLVDRVYLCEVGRCEEQRHGDGQDMRNGLCWCGVYRTKTRRFTSDDLWWTEMILHGQHTPKRNKHGR